MRRILSGFFLLVPALAGCGSQGAVPQHPSSPEIPSNVQAAAESALGPETQVLAYGDLAKDGAQQALAVSGIEDSGRPGGEAGTIIVRATIIENRNGRWSEIFRADDRLQNTRGYLTGAPPVAVGSWRIQYARDPNYGLTMYFTPLNAAGATAPAKIVVRWNAQAKRYQALAANGRSFQGESASLELPEVEIR